MPETQVTITASRLLLVLLISMTALPAPAGPLRISLEVDASNVMQGIQHVQLTLPVQAGPLALAYPKWIPGEHKPAGPITQLMNLTIAAGSETLRWRRDPLDAYLIRLEVPTGASVLDVRFDYFSPPQTFGGGFGNSPNTTPHLLVLGFNQFVLYPADASAHDIEIKARVVIPRGWSFDGALEPEQIRGAELEFPVASLSTLVDSPLLAGEHFRTIPLTQGNAATRMSIAADSPRDLAVSDSVIAGMRGLVSETTALFGPAHYRQYVWLLALSDSLRHDGLEHHESSDVRAAEGMFTDPAQAINWRLFPHEFVHSWNGKYRRPDGLATRNYQQPMVDDLLWVYEGLTRYYGDFVLAARSAMATREQSRDYLAYIAAQMDRNRPGRAWRTVADTATVIPAYADAPVAWRTIRRGADYYSEMLLVWLEADMRIRQETRGKRSLDDFCRSFFAGSRQIPEVKSYSRSDVISALNGIAPLDWNSFFDSRVEAINAQAPLDGIRASGWALTYDETSNDFVDALERVSSTDDLSLSLGTWTKPDGTIVDVVTDSPAFAAGLAPAMRLIAINGQKWSIEAARRALIGVGKNTQPLELIAAADDVVRTLHVNYHGGLRYPHLTRDSSKPDALSEILAPRSALRE